MPRTILHNVRVFGRIVREKFFTPAAERARREQMEKEVMVQSIVGMLHQQKTERDQANEALNSIMRETLNIAEELEKIKKSVCSGC